MTHELRPLIDAYCHGSATDAQLDSLAALLRDDADARRVFAEAMDLHAALRWRETAGARSSHVPAPASVRAASAGRSNPLRISPVAWSIAAALLLTAAAVAIYVFAINPQSEIRSPKSVAPVATLIDATGQVFAGDSLANPGSEYVAGVYSIESGEAEFLLTNRVAVTLTGAASLTMHSDMAATLNHGSASFRCPPGAEGYTVHIPGGVRVVDLGTAFAIRIEPDGSCRIAVTEGRVEVLDGDHRLALLSDRQRMVVAADGQPGEVVTAAAPVLVDHYPFDGDGADIAGDDNSASLGANVEFVDGRIGRAVHFPANPSAGARVVVPARQAFDPGVGGFSVVFWARLDTDKPSGYPAGVLDALKDASVGYHLAFGRGELVLRLDGRTSHVIAHAPVSMGDASAFRHYAITVDRTPGEERVRFYEAGEMTADVPIDALADTDALSPSQGLVIGLFNDRNGLAGSLDDLRFYTGVLSPDDVFDLYDTGRVTPVDATPTRPRAAGTADPPRASSTDDPGDVGEIHTPVSE